MSSRIAARYGKSLLQFASENGVADRVYTDMQELIKLGSTSVEFRDLIKSPVIGAEAKSKIFDALFANFSEESRAFARMCAGRRREAFLTDMASHFVELYDDSRGIARATVVSAIPLNDAVLDQLKRYLGSVLQKSDVQLNNVTDSSVIGGLVVRYKDRLLDMSVSRELRQLRKELIFNN